MAKLTLKQIFLNEIDNQPRGYAEILAELAGYSSGSALKKVLRDENKEFDKFLGLVNLVHTECKGRIVKTMTEYAHTLDPNNKTSRYFLEYSERHGLVELKEYLIEKLINCGNNTSKEWAKIYQTNHLFETGVIGLNEAMNRFSLINPKHPDTKVATEIYKAYCYLKEEQYGMIYHTLLTVSVYLPEIKEPYIRNQFQGRYYLLLTEHYARKNEMTKARECCNAIINNNEIDYFRGWAYLNLGNSYIIDNFDKALECFNKGLEVAAEHERNLLSNLKRSVNFLCNVWNVDPKYLDLESKFESDIHEIAFYYINKKQYTMAEQTLNKVDIDKLPSNSLGFHYYMRGLLTNNIDYYAKSVKSFIDSGDYYYRQLPLLKIKEFGYPDSIIDLLLR